MQEKIIVMSKHYSLKKFLIVATIITILLNLIVWPLFWFGFCYGFDLDYIRDTYYSIVDSPIDATVCCLHFDIFENCDLSWYTWYTSEDIALNIEKLDKAWKEFLNLHPTFNSYLLCCYCRVVVWGLPILIICLLLYLIPYFGLSSYSLTITNSRVYGKAAFGKRVDLPIDSISAVGTSFLKGIYIGTSSGTIKFKLIKNQDKIHSVISKLLIERQQAEKNNIAQNNEHSINADELKKIKDLLDSGVITQEEFEQKKKQLLGL